MSKFDKLFNTPQATRNTDTSYLDKKPNSFISRADAVEKSKTYHFVEDQFPVFSSTKADDKASALATESKKYSDITSTLTEVEVEVIKSNPVIPGWTQYSICKKTGKIEVLYGSKTRNQMEQEKEEAKMNNSLYIYRQMVSSLEQNWARYKKQYDKIHGNGAYELAHYSEPVYPDDEYSFDGEPEKEKEKEKGYENDDYEYNSYSLGDTKKKNYSVIGKQ